MFGEFSSTDCMEVSFLQVSSESNSDGCLNSFSRIPLPESPPRIGLPKIEKNKFPEIDGDVLPK